MAALVPHAHRYAGVVTWHHRAVPDGGEADVDRAPICPHCGVTALAADIATVLDAGFVCENPDCEGFGDLLEPRC